MSCKNDVLIIFCLLKSIFFIRNACQRNFNEFVKTITFSIPLPLSTLPFFQKNLGEHSELQDEEIAAELKQLIGDLEKKVL